MSAPRLTLDDQIFTRQSRGGISRYFVELLREFTLSPELGIEVDQRRWWTGNQHLVEAGLGRTLPSALLSRRAQMTANAPLRVRHPDILHHTFYGRGYLHVGRAPRIRAVTIYDMIPEVYPELFPTGSPHFDKREYVQAADVIFCISASARDDMIRFYGVPAAPVVVTHLAVSPNFVPTAKAIGLPERYILQVGARSAYKDFWVLVEAFAHLPAGSPTLHLVVVGPPFTPAESARLDEWHIADRVLRADLADAEMPGAYANAMCFVYPSRYEGFGLPTLEAMSSGCPAILADSSSHGEIGGTAALYFPPGDVAALGELIKEVLCDADRRTALARIGLARAAEFSWRRTAERTAEGYRAAGQK